jgi:tetrapyrrole methylase family protein / MazG family protein
MTRPRPSKAKTRKKPNARPGGRLKSRIKPKSKTNVGDLIQVMETLLSPGGCPWDREQTPKSLTPFAIEEAHELAEAIEKGDLEATKEELGDLLLQVIFHTSLAKRLGQFTLEDVIETICTKLIRRHPHVFGETKVADSDEVLKNWNIIKAQEKGNQKRPGMGIPQSLPALQRAQKIGDKTKNLRFDWNTPTDVMKKVDEEIRELKQAFEKGDLKHTEEELGDVFFVLAQLARHLKLEAETVARAANRKFENRFSKLLQLAESRNQDFQSLSVSQKEQMWEEVKRQT